MDQDKENIIRSHLEAVEYYRGSVASAIWRGFKEYPMKTALLDTSSGETYTYSDLQNTTENVARHLHDLGLKKGEIVTFYSSNCLEYAVTILAVWRLGATPALLNAMSTAYDLNRELKKTKSTILFTNNCGSALKGALNSTVKHIVSPVQHSACIWFNTLATKATSAPLPELSQLTTNPDEDVAVVLFSSGTTGLPKAVQITHTNLNAEISCLCHPAMEPISDKFLIFQPLAHIYGTGVLVWSISTGAIFMLMKQFTLDGYIELAAKHKLNSLSLVPPVSVLLTKSGLLKKHDLSAVDNFLNAAAPLSYNVEKELIEQLGGNIQARQAYGLTETTGMITSTPARKYMEKGRNLHNGSVGVLAHSCEAKVVDTDTGKSLPANKEGELCFRGPIIMKGYMDNPKATADTIDQDGWLHTGDIGFYDENGYFYIVDRLKELIKYNANQVPPSELEALILTHPEVADVGVVGKPDPVTGELPMAWVVKKPNVSVSEKDIQDFVAERVAPYKKLRGGVTFVQAIPKSPSGKILRNVIKEGVRKGTANAKL